MPDVPTPNLKVNSFPGVLPKPARVRPKPPRGQSAASLKKKATVAHSRYVRARAGRCERCGKDDGRLECAHIVSRRYAATRTDENGAWCLCSGCHRYLTENPFEHVTFANLTLGVGGYQALRDKAYAGVGQVLRVDFWRGELERLERKLAAVSSPGGNSDA